MIPEKYDFAAIRTATVLQLTKANLIDEDDVIDLKPFHEYYDGKSISCHFKIRCKKSNQQFLLKSIKPGDSLIYCNEFLKTICKEGKYSYPVMVIQPFKVQENQFYITSFLEGKNLDEISDVLTLDEWNQIAGKLMERLKELSSVTADRYSTSCGFVNEDCAQILKNKFTARFTHPLINVLLNGHRDSVYRHCCKILDGSRYSVPTLLHMDIKPANIIYNRNTGELTLVDFELSRFGDEDFGKIQILLSGINGFSNRYNQYIYPELAKLLPSFKEAETTPKLIIYLFYQTMCNVIYYYDHDIACPEKMTNLFFRLLQKFLYEENI